MGWRDEEVLERASQAFRPSSDLLEGLLGCLDHANGERQERLLGGCTDCGTLRKRRQNVDGRLVGNGFSLYDSTLRKSYVDPRVVRDLGESLRGADELLEEFPEVDFLGMLRGLVDKASKRGPASICLGLFKVCVAYLGCRQWTR